MAGVEVAGVLAPRSPPGHTPGGVHAGCPVTDEADKSHRFAFTGQDPQGRNRTIIVWREADLVNGTVVRRLTLDATMTTVTVLTCPEAREVAQAILAAAR